MLPSVLAALLVSILPVPSALAITSLKQVQISNGSQIDLLFDGKVQKGQIKTEFFNDIIQVSIQDVSVYPAKISSVNGGSLTKIFAYQYAPKLVRCRLTVKGKAEDYKDQFEVKAAGKILTVRMADGASASQGGARRELPEGDAAKGESAAPAAQRADEAEERALLSRVLAADADSQAGKAAKDAKDSKEAKDAITVSTSSPVTTEGKEIPASRGTGGSTKLAGGKPLPSPLRAFGKLAVVLAVFGMFAMVLKRFARNRATGQIGDALASDGLASDGEDAASGILGRVAKLAKKNFGRSNKLIEVLSTHHLGPKKSIAVVRVGGRVLVLGVTNEAINLITQLSGDATDAASAVEGLALGGLGDMLGASAARPKSAAAPAPKAPSPAAARLGAGAAAGDPVFADLLRDESAKVSFHRGAGAYAAAGARPSDPDLSAIGLGDAPKTIPGASQDSLSSVRAQIRNRLEGLKQL